jgi:hypothetical protein
MAGLDIWASVPWTCLGLCGICFTVVGITAVGIHPSPISVVVVVGVVAVADDNVLN